MRDTIDCPAPLEKMDFNIYRYNIIGGRFVCGWIFLCVSLHLCNISPVCHQSCPLEGLQGQLLWYCSFIIHVRCLSFNWCYIKEKEKESPGTTLFLLLKLNSQGSGRIRQDSEQDWVYVAVCMSARYDVQNLLHLWGHVPWSVLEFIRFVPFPVNNWK